jgi:hypothetical protein
MYIVNTITINMLSEQFRNRPEGGSIRYRSLSLSEARAIAQGGLTPAFGHEQSAPLVQAQLQAPEPIFARPTLRFDGPTQVLLAQYVGPRLPEGATELPEGAVIEYFLVSFFE